MEKWRLEHPHDTPPYRFTPSPTFGNSSKFLSFDDDETDLLGRNRERCFILASWRFGLTRFFLHPHHLGLWVATPCRLARIFTSMNATLKYAEQLLIQIRPLMTQPLRRLVGSIVNEMDPLKQFPKGHSLLIDATMKRSWRPSTTPA